MTINFHYFMASIFFPMMLTWYLCVRSKFPAKNRNWAIFLFMFGPGIEAALGAFKTGAISPTGLALAFAVFFSGLIWWLVRTCVHEIGILKTRHLSLAGWVFGIAVLISGLIWFFVRMSI